MNITIIAVGSRGDIQPSLALAVGLKEAGFTPLLAIPENFVAMGHAFGIDVFPIHGDWEALIQGQMGRALAESGQNLFAATRTLMKLLGPLLHQISQDIVAACGGADVLICHGAATHYGVMAAQYHKIPFITATPMPFTPTGDYPSVLFPTTRNMGRHINRLSHQILQRMMWIVIGRSALKERLALGLPRLTYHEFYATLKQGPTLESYSPQVVPPAQDWVRPVYVTGYWFLDEPQWTPPDDLQAFLDAGEKPVYIGFGSMVGNPEMTTHLVMEALAYTGQRAILMTGWGGLNPDDVPSHIFLLKGAPHNRLFPHMAAVVHHGGAGTTAAGLQAGLPTLIIPHVADQFFWGSRLEALGVSPRPIPRSNLTAVKLAAALDALRQPGMRDQAAQLGAKIRAENGVQNAIAMIRHTLEKRSSIKV